MRIGALWLTLICLGCASRVQEPINAEEFLSSGSWHRSSDTDEMHYGTLEFRKDGSAVFTSAGDTLFRFSYEAEAGRILLTDPMGQTEVLTYQPTGDSTICFDHMREYDSRVCYNRKRP